MKPLTAHLRAAATGLGLLVLSNGPLFYIGRTILDEPTGFESFPVRHAIAGVALAGTMAWMVRVLRSPPGQRHSWAGLAIISFSMLGWVSGWWSAIGGLTRGRSLMYFGLGFLSWWLGLQTARFLRLSCIYFGLAGCTTSVLVLIFRFDAGVNELGDWVGVYTSGNSLGPVCVILILALGYQFWGEGSTATLRQQLVVSSAMVGAFGLLIGSGSRTAGFAMVLSVLAAKSITTIPGSDFVPSRSQGMVFLGVLPLVLASTAWLMSGTSTVRTRWLIWKVVWYAAQQKPWLGHGFFVFWDDPTLTRYPYLRLGSDFGSAHNSFLETLLGLGIVGLVLYVSIFATSLGRALRGHMRLSSAASGFVAAITVFLALENLTESFVLWFSYNWVLMGAVAISGFTQNQPARLS